MSVEKSLEKCRQWLSLNEMSEASFVVAGFEQIPLDFWVMNHVLERHRKKF